MPRERERERERERGKASSFGTNKANFSRVSWLFGVFLFSFCPANHQEIDIFRQCNIFKNKYYEYDLNFWILMYFLDVSRELTKRCKFASLSVSQHDATVMGFLPFLNSDRLDIIHWHSVVYRSMEIIFWKAIQSISTGSELWWLINFAAK